MFDRLIVNPRRSETHHHTHSITIGRAPTDESVKLLKEFEKEAEKKYLEKFQIANNDLNIVAVYHFHDFTGESELVVKFKLNGKEYVCKKSMDIMWRFQTMEEKIHSIATELSNAITCEIMKNNFKDFTHAVKG